ncbi:carboxylesterase/lipase family protein [Dactylosporangium sp. NPDC051541]|uniref:carboxylesterase/lipase family protein n=1 Tax=Dactylosporangium sp. NPDC051541 TaxID=3363977 RepID=UPI0037B6368A
MSSAVRTAAGALRGRVEAGVTVFRGIPFAAPPVGALRFAAPRPAAPWDGVREAFSFGPPPPQPAPFGRTETVAGDDWLTVNVWTASPSPDAARPVMVWIQGGGFTIGKSGNPEYDGARLAREAGVVVVTFNYRVGFEGFAQIAGAPANRGLLDQVAALEWVRDEIRAFGGDPDRVTVFGESAGASSVACLLAMPRAAGLFQRAIAQSVPGAFFTPKLAADIAAACTAELGLGATVAQLADVDPELLVEAAIEVAGKMPARAAQWGRVGHRAVQFAPVIDGDVLPAHPFTAIAAGASGPVELIAGHTRDEHRLFSALTGVLGQVTAEQAAEALRIFAPGPDGEARYREAFPDAAPEQLYELVHGDWLFRMPSLRLAEAHAAGGGRTYLYELTWAAPSLGAAHGLDVPLVFGNLEGNQPAMLFGDAGADAEALSEQLRTAWTAFAVTGDPGWPQYDAEQRRTRLFDITPEVAAYPEEASRRIWQDYAFPALPLIE